MKFINYGTNKELDALVKSSDINHRMSMVLEGYGLDYLINDNDYLIRKAIAEQGYGLELLINDENDIVRAEALRNSPMTLSLAEQYINDNSSLVRNVIATKGLFLNVLVNDESSYVRQEVAKWRYGLDVLKDDVSTAVRAEVARQGYALDYLANDEYEAVRSIAIEQLAKGDKLFECTLVNGDKSFGLFESQKKALESAMYFTHCLKLDSAELAVAQHSDSRYSIDDIRSLQHSVEEDKLSLKNAMLGMEKEHIPNWVGNGAMEWAKIHDLRAHNISDFFIRSKYAINSVNKDKSYTIEM